LDLKTEPKYFENTYNYEADVEVIGTYKSAEENF